MNYSDLLATVALVISVLTAGWTAVRALRWDRPVVSVSGTQWIGERSTAVGRRVAGFTMEVVNTGNQGTQVIHAYWQIDRGDGVMIRYTASHGGGGIESLFAAPDGDEAPALPFTLGRYERRAWDFDMSLSNFKDPERMLRAQPSRRNHWNQRRI